jgi:methylmalonyl-CoA mutase cobalamin-binding subunit
LSGMGVARIFAPDTTTTEIVAWVREKFGHEVTQNQA